MKLVQVTLRSTTATSTKTSSQNTALHCPSRSLHTMLAKNPEDELIGALRLQNKNREWNRRSHLFAHVVVKTSNLVISPRCYADYRTNMCENACRTCSTIFPYFKVMLHELLHGTTFNDTLSAFLLNEKTGRSGGTTNGTFLAPGIFSEKRNSFTRTLVFSFSPKWLVHR